MEGDKKCKILERWKITIILEKTPQKFYKNPTFVIFCDDCISDVI